MRPTSPRRGNHRGHSRREYPVYAGQGLAAPTKGRAFDRIRLGSENVDQTRKAMGGSNVSRADKAHSPPGETFIEIGQGLAAAK